LSDKIVMGFIVNPIAGMGGSVGLKGTDGDAYIRALERGAKPVAPQIALEFLNYINIDDFKLHVADGVMGLDIAMVSKHRDKIEEIYGEVGSETSAQDTIRIAGEMVENVDIIVFVGGDGTARDICRAVDQETIVLGVPSGVKMYSSVFAVNARAAALVFEEYVKGNVDIVEREVVDIDEESFRRDKLDLKIYCYMKTPVFSNYVQSMKSPSQSTGFEEDNKWAIARYVVEKIIKKNALYILGPGSTVKTINKFLNQPYTLLGVDALYNYNVIGLDLWEKPLLELIDRFGEAYIIVSPIGGQGFIFGRGNQQISPNVIKRVGVDNVIVISTWSKINELSVLRVDTRDPELDEKLCRYVRVLVDYNRFVVKKVEC